MCLQCPIEAIDWHWLDSTADQNSHHVSPKWKSNHSSMEFLDIRFLDLLCSHGHGKHSQCPFWKNANVNTVSTPSTLHVLTFISFQSFQLPSFLLLFLALKRARLNGFKQRSFIYHPAARPHGTGTTTVYSGWLNSLWSTWWDHWESARKPWMRTQSQWSDMATTTACSIKGINQKRKVICLRVQSSKRWCLAPKANQIASSRLDPDRTIRPQACSPPGLLSAVVASDCIWAWITRFLYSSWCSMCFFENSNIYIYIYVIIIIYIFYIVCIYLYIYIYIRMEYMCICLLHII